MLINLNKTGLMIQTFELCLRLWDSFADTGSDYWMTGRTNVCHFVRTIVVAGPLALLASLGLWSFIVYVAAVYPVLRFGFVTYGTVIGGVGSAVLFIMGIVWLIRLVDRFLPAKTPKPPKPRKERRNFISEAANIFWAWIVAAKQRVCPLVETTP